MDTGLLLAMLLGAVVGNLIAVLLISGWNYTSYRRRTRRSHGRNKPPFLPPEM